jgi:hypothetical protein
VVPQDLRHTREREWAQLTAPGTVRVGPRLDNRVLVRLPVLGARVGAGRTAGEVESTRYGGTRQLINSDARRGGALAYAKRAASDHTEYTEQG